MDYTLAEQIGRDTVISGVRHLHLAQTLDNGQAFRFSGADNRFSGIAHGRRLELALDGDTLTLYDVELPQFESIWRDFFDFNRDYSELHKTLAQAPNSDALQKALQFSPGLRLLRQDIWEVLVSFILSQNSNIPRIKKMVEQLCQSFGAALPCGGYAFPEPKVLAQLSPEDLAPVRAGYRNRYIIDAATRVASGEIDLAKLSETAGSDEIKDALLKIRGVGPKVADCVLLYGFGRVEHYPSDVWIKRVMAAHFPDGFPAEIEGVSGIAQQFLFHYVRNKGV